MSKKKQVLILCTGNSCRSIIAEAMINAKLGDCVDAQSSGVKASGKVNPNAQALLESKGEWKSIYHSKETCPIFPNAVKTIHVGFDDPSGKEVKEYEITYDLIKEKLLPVIERELCL